MRSGFTYHQAVDLCTLFDGNSINPDEAPMPREVGPKGVLHKFMGYTGKVLRAYRVPGTDIVMIRVMYGVQRIYGSMIVHFFLLFII